MIKAVFQSRQMQCVNLSFAFLFLLVIPISGVYATVDSALQTIDLSQKERSFLKTKQNIRLCVKISNLAIEGTNHEGEYAGVLADINNLIAKKIGKPIVIVKVDEQDLLSEYLGRMCDAFSTPLLSRKNNKLLNYSQPYFQETVSMAISNEQMPIYDLKYLTDKRFAVNEESVLFETLQDKYPAIQFIPVYNAKIGLAMVTAGHVYGYIDCLTTLVYQAKKNGVIGIKTIDFLDNKFQSYYVTSNQQTILLDIFNKAILSITEAEKNNIISTWAGINYQKKVVNYSLALWSVTLLLTILAICLSLVFKIRRQKSYLAESLKTLSLENEQLSADLNEQLHLEKQSIRFAEMFSHEYRTPVSIISTNLDILDLKNNQIPLHIDSQLEKMRDAVSKLIVLVETALDRECLASTNLIAEKADMDFYQLMNEVKEEMDSNYPKRKLEIQATEKSCILHGDRKLLKIMLNNLLENAFKYSHINQPVTVKIYTDNGKLFVTVIDKGIGIPYADIKHIFDKYHRASNTSNTPGIGLGLYLSKLIVAQHKGNISVVCPPEGGTQIKIELPQ